MPLAKPRITFHPRPWREAFETALAGDTAVIACHFNPCGYVRPVENLRRFLSMCAADAVPLFMAELAFGDAPSFLPENERIAHFRTSPENLLFHKEALLNAAEKIVPPQFTKIVWLDADILLTDREWFLKASRALSGGVVAGQPFKRCVWSDAAGNEKKIIPSTAKRMAIRCRESSDWSKAHPGFGGMARRLLWREFGGLYPYAIGGHGDMLFWLAAQQRFDRLNQATQPLSSPAFTHALQWARLLGGWTGGKAACGDGDAIHLWHGDLRARGYREKLVMLKDFDPVRHVSAASGFLEWTDAARREIPQTIEALAENFAKREEDG